MSFSHFSMFYGQRHRPLFSTIISRMLVQQAASMDEIVSPSEAKVDFYFWFSVLFLFLCFCFSYYITVQYNETCFPLKKIRHVFYLLQRIWFH